MTVGFAGRWASAAWEANPTKSEATIRAIRAWRISDPLGKRGRMYPFPRYASTRAATVLAGPRSHTRRLATLNGATHVHETHLRCGGPVRGRARDATCRRAI